jgi:serine/threonine protein phosphatase 1
VTYQLAFIGDIHGCLPALHGILRVVDEIEVRHTVFLGDYVNKGGHSSEVLGEVLAIAADGAATLLAGNHERAMVLALDGGDLAPFLKMGGATTIRSYVGAKVGPDVRAQFRASVPVEHLEALRSMPEAYEAQGVIAAHTFSAPSDSRYRVSAHVNVGPVPVFSRGGAQIDTGCSGASGRLTALLWPSLRVVQVDNMGRPCGGGTTVKPSIDR